MPQIQRHYDCDNDYRVILSRCGVLFGTKTWTYSDMVASGCFNDLQKQVTSAFYKLISDHVITIVGNTERRTHIYKFTNVGFEAFTRLSPEADSA